MSNVWAQERFMQGLERRGTRGRTVCLGLREILQKKMHCREKGEQNNKSESASSLAARVVDAKGNKGMAGHTT